MQGRERRKERKTSNISPEGREKNTRFRDFSRVGRMKKRVRDERGGGGASFSTVGKNHVPRLCARYDIHGGVGRPASVRGSPPLGRGGGKSGNGGSKARNDSRLWRVGSGSEDISSSPFHPDRRRVRWPSRGRMGGRKLLFHLRLRQLGKTAASVCFLITKERE